jgi:2-polyprenyl-6-methoxyphenol hydroxylase-like FAD-dependent oxidoreductase
VTDVVIVGGGFAGCAGAVFLARRGHAVTLIERDGPPPDAGPDADFGDWRRPGVPQARQSHALLARARRVLVDEVPDVVEHLLERGVHEQEIGVGAGTVPGETMLSTRRLVAEAVVRRAAEREPGVTVRSGDAVVALTATSGADHPVVTGVRTESGAVVPAQLVVDAGGRRSAAPRWLDELGARPIVEESQELGFFYLTRYYRVHPGFDRPVIPVPSGVPLDYGNALSFGADNDAFSLSLTLSVRDPLRQALREPARFDRFFEAVPRTAPLVAIGEPITDISMMARIENRRRRFVDDDGPVVGGVVPLGDAALHTNPTLGRGISLAVWQAQHLAASADAAADDPTAFVADYHEWTRANLDVWFDTQKSIDAASIDRLEAGVRGVRTPTSSEPATRRAVAATVLAQTDPVVGTAVTRMFHLLASPADALGEPEVARRLDAFLRTDPDLERPPDSPTRAEFESIAVG